LPLQPTLERETMLAEVRAHYGEIPGQDAPQRWLRGRIHQRDDGFEVEVNSPSASNASWRCFASSARSRGSRASSSSTRMRICRHFVAGRCSRSPPRPSPTPPGASTGPTRPLPALGGRTPRQSARRERDQPPLEALLRELEHDADLLARRGLEVPDVGGLRRALQMPAEAWMG